MMREKLIALVKFHVEDFVDKYANNPDMQKVILNMFNQRYESAFSDLSKKISEEQEYKDRIAALESEIQELKVRNRELSADYRKASATNARLNKQLDFSLNLDLYEDLMIRKIVSPLDAENVQILLKNAGLVKGKEMVDVEEFDGIFTEEVFDKISEENRVCVADDDTENNLAPLISKEVVLGENSKKNKEAVVDMFNFFNNRK